MALAPLETLYDTELDVTLPMPPELAMVYGKLQFPQFTPGPYVISNFVATLDGVVSLNIPGRSGGGEISGQKQQDRMVMGLLRAAADAVVVGAGTLRAVPKHLWTAEYIFPALAAAYHALRIMLGKPEFPLNVIVTASGDLDLTLPVFASGRVPALVVTNQEGIVHLREHPLPPSVTVQAVPTGERLTARAVLDAIERVQPAKMVLVEGGPQLLGDFLAEKQCAELFLTLSPQIAGRSESEPRPGLVEGQILAPDHAVWSNLLSVKRGDDHLFLRYSLGAPAPEHG